MAEEFTVPGPVIYPCCDVCRLGFSHDPCWCCGELTGLRMSEMEDGHPLRRHAAIYWMRSYQSWKDALI